VSADATVLPLFPLRLVLFPGAQLPLHIFEPRYRRMLADCRDGDGRFGIILASGAGERDLPSGHVGCVAEVRDVSTLPDGRANVLVEGAERFALDHFLVSELPYHVAVVTPFGDRAEAADAEETARVAEQVRAAFGRLARAARTIAEDADPLPELPEDPVALGFRIAALVDFDLETRQRLLASRSALGRLRTLAGLLERATPGVELRAEVHERAKRNGHGPYPHPPAA
jgi:Lon protease-like protein